MVLQCVKRVRGASPNLGGSSYARGRDKKNGKRGLITFLFKRTGGGQRVVAINATVKGGEGAESLRGKLIFLAPGNPDV